MSFLVVVLVGLGCLIAGSILGFLYGSRVKAATLAELQKLRNAAGDAIKGKG